jgi:hypothetical protein
MKTNAKKSPKPTTQAALAKGHPRLKDQPNKPKNPVPIAEPKTAIA